jgi:hypothetical protein
MTDDTARPPPTVTYYAISLLSSRTTWFGVATTLLGIFSLPEVAALVPLRYLPAILSVIGFAIIALRSVTVRPVALILPGDTKPITVPKVGPPPPPLVGD